jgi:ABC-type lipoprotein export system ATPase subunit/GNAT superfamily N-acetyltransferase
MTSLTITKEVEVPQSYRVAKVQGMFDIPAKGKLQTTINVDFPLEPNGWSVGAIVGASGSGKTTVARYVFDEGSVLLPRPEQWSGKPIVDEFPKELSVDQIVSGLTSVGLSSSPTWLKPFHVLSMGEQARAHTARALLAGQLLDAPTVLDEFTSVVDRTVARSLSVAVARWVRQNQQRFVAVSCHKDILPWLDPDWVLDLDTRRFLQPSSGRGRPPIQLRVYPGSLEAWTLFAQHHYMSADISRSARVFLATVEFPDEGQERLAGFFSILPVVGMKGWWRGHRTVVLPDYQGLGIGNQMVERVADWLWWTERKRYRATTSAPGLVKHRLKRPERWRLASGPANRAPSGNKKLGLKTSAGRLTTSWEYIPRNREDAEANALKFGVVGVKIRDVSGSVGFDIVKGEGKVYAYNFNDGEGLPGSDAGRQTLPERELLSQGADRIDFAGTEDRLNELLLEPEGTHE